MKILSIIPYTIYPAKMGGQKGIALFYKYFCNYVNLTCVSVKKNDQQFVENYDLIKMFSNRRLRYINLLYFFKLRKIIRQKKITHLIIEHPYYGWLGWMLKKNLNITLIVHSHNIEALRFKSMHKWWWRILWHYEKFVHKKADINFFVTDEDRKYAIEKFNLAESNCFTIPYGVDFSTPPSNKEKEAAREKIKLQYGIAEDEKTLLFNGTLDYKPNQDALDIILTKINPRLLKQHFKYKIIICGKNLPKAYNELKNYENKNIIFGGFVDDITIYFKAADIFINPVNDGGGIKTKVVEALGYNMDVVTTKNGSIGIPITTTGKKMAIIENNWILFTQEIINCDQTNFIPQGFFNYFYWGNIAAHAESCILNSSK